MTKAGSVLRAIFSDIEAANYQTPNDRILQRISKLDLPAREHFEGYMLHKWRMNHRPSTLKGSFVAVSSFLIFYGGRGKSHIEDIVSNDLAACIEHEQDGELKSTTVRTRRHCLCACLRFLIELDSVDGRRLSR